MTGVSSLPSWRQTWAFRKLQSSISGTSTRGSYFDDVGLWHTSTGPGVLSKVGSGIPDVDFQLHEKSRSRGVALIIIHSKTSSHCNIAISFDSIANVMAHYIIPLIFITCLFLCGLRSIILPVPMSYSERNDEWNAAISVDTERYTEKWNHSRSATDCSGCGHSYRRRKSKILIDSGLQILPLWLRKQRSIELNIYLFE